MAAPWVLGGFLPDEAPLPADDQHLFASFTPSSTQLDPEATGWTVSNGIDIEPLQYQSLNHVVEPLATESFAWPAGQATSQANNGIVQAQSMNNSNVDEPHMPPPSVRPRKRKAPTLRDEDWEPVKARVIELHIDGKLHLSTVKAMIEEEFEGFNATPRQYRSQISKWGRDKNVKRNEMKAVVRKRQQRNFFEPHKRELKFTVRGVEVSTANIDRWMKRYNIPQDMAYSPSPDADTPEAVSAHTASVQGSPAAASPAFTVASPSMQLLRQPNPVVGVASPAASTISDWLPEGSFFAGRSPVLGNRSLAMIPVANNPGRPLQVQSAIPQYPFKREEDEARKELARREALWGAGHEGTLGALGQLGDVLIKQGRYKSAESTFRQLRALCRQNHGDHHHETYIALRRLGSAYFFQGIYQNAERLLQKALKGLKAILGPSHPATLHAMDLVARFLGGQGSYEEAEAMYRQVVAASEEILGPQHPTTLSSMQGLAINLRCQGRYEEAEAMFRQVIAAREEVLGPQHPFTLSSMQGLADTLVEQERYDGAEAMLRQVVAATEEVLGPEHPETLTAVSDLAVSLHRRFRLDEAAPLYDRAWQGFRAVLGEKHPYTQTCLRHYSDMRTTQKYFEAQASGEQVD